MTKHKNVALDELRILAALMVLGVHTGQKVGLGDAAAVGAQGVQLFFVLSGYLAAASLSRHPEPLPYYQRRIRLILPEDTTFGVRISGDSMEPEFHDGQIAWVLQQESVANGEIGIFALNGEAYIKKLQNDKDGIFLISLNEKYAPIKVGENDRLDIFGKSDASAITGHC